jgi:hypothetical protein
MTRKRKCITETAAFCKRIETEWGRDFLPLGLLEEMGVDMGHVRTLVRYGWIRVC